MPEHKTIYVAETDESGAVQFVWVGSEGKRVARPFNPSRHNLQNRLPAEFSGASQTKIESWMAKRIEEEHL